MLTNCAGCGEPKLIAVPHDVLDHTPELSKAVGLTQHETVQHNRHDQGSARRFFEHFIKLIDEILAIEL